MAFQLPDLSKELAREEKGLPAVKSDPITAAITSLFGGGGSKDMPGLNYMGDFDVDSFVGSTLDKNRKGGAGGITELIGGAFKALGL